MGKKRKRKLKTKTKKQKQAKKEKKRKKREQQTTRGHNIVADGWAGASNPHPNPNSHPHTHKRTQKVSKTLVFPLFDSISTDGPTDQRTDKASYRVACPQLKNENFVN